MARRYLVTGILVLCGLVLHASVFDWESRRIAGRYVDGAMVTALGVWPADGVALPVALLVGVMVPSVLLGLAAYLSRSFLAAACGRLLPLLRLGSQAEPGTDARHAGDARYGSIPMHKSPRGGACPLAAAG